MFWYGVVLLLMLAAALYSCRGPAAAAPCAEASGLHQQEPPRELPQERPQEGDYYDPVSQSARPRSTRFYPQTVPSHRTPEGATSW